MSAQRWGRCILLVYAMMMLVTIILEIVAGSVLLQAMGKLKSPALGSLQQDSVDILINNTYKDCCLDGHTDCWTFRHSSIVTNPASCKDEETFRKDFCRWMVTKLTPMAATCLAFLSLEILVVVGSCCAICGRRQADKKSAQRRGKALEEEEADLDLEADTDPVPPKARHACPPPPPLPTSNPHLPPPHTPT